MTMEMSTVLLLCLSSVMTATQASYVCQRSYTPSRNIGYPRVPTNCFATTPSACPRSWKSGIPEGRATSTPSVYSEFLICHEAFSTCGYVPINPRNGDVRGNSGVTIGAGVDLGSELMTLSSLSALPRSLVDKIRPYLGLTANFAACAAIEKPLKLFPSEALSLTNVTKDMVIKSVEARYNGDRAIKSPPFASLPRGIRTAMVSVWFQFGEPRAYPKFWNFVRENDWEGAVKELRSFVKNPDDKILGNVRRRNDEADIIEATIVKCDRSIDAVILLDESGSVSPECFAQSLEFVKNLTRAFSDDKLRASDGTRIGFSTFSHTYTPRFYLSSYTSKSDYLRAVSGVQQKGGTTSLGYALKRIVDQFSTENGLRGDEYGIPRVLVVLTDGKSYDAVKIPAEHLRKRNVVIYAIGIGKYDRLQLRAVASSRSHVHMLNTFFELETFVATLTAATCNEPRPVTLAKILYKTSERETHEYFVYKARPNSMLKVNVTDVSGETTVYVSNSSPHPYKYDNYMAFRTSSQKNKVIVVAVKDHNKSMKRSIPGGKMKPVYVSVWANTKKASFTIEGSICSPLNCTEGTNEVISALSTASFIKSYSIIAFVSAMLCVFNTGL